VIAAWWCITECFDGKWPYPRAVVGLFGVSFVFGGDGHVGCRADVVGAVFNCVFGVWVTNRDINV
jgi:hypothetical protein